MRGNGLSGLADRGGRGRKPVYGEATGRRILAQIDQPVPFWLCALDRPADRRGAR